MSSISLGPSQAAVLAKDIYALTEQPSLDLAIRFLNTQHGNLFEFANQSLLKGKTGGPGIIKCQTAFGFCLLGKNQLKGHAFIIFRGTQYIADWLTNVNCSISRSSYNQLVHDGFNKSFKSMQPQLTEFMGVARGQGISTVHCIGHSLGGALATLCAEWLKASLEIKPFLYSFGSPRVGLQDFSQMCTSNIGNDRIFRAYHKTDVVPCIPPWPFIHTPNSGKDYYLPSPGVMPGGTYHSMGRYVDSVANKSWQGLAGLKPEKKSDAGIAVWLKSETPFGFGVTVIEWLQDAIIFVLKKCVAGAEWLISQAAGTSLTILDQLSYMLAKGIDLAQNVSSWVVYLIKKILRFLGYSPVVDSAEMTQMFIRSVLFRLHNKLNIIAKNALSQAIVEGRAI